MAATHNFVTSTGVVITVYWSKMGKWADRKQSFGSRAKASWKAEKLHEDTWHLPASTPHSDVRKLLEELLVKSDRAIVVFPHGSNAGGSAQMSVHTYNC
ncbi:MAG: hypothetical protein EP329_08645 [Deltaproteobacteria bacterium]|nr:MAG: hypothetical protein EP329_08645 [Deltaproteobacteria bacterium]